VGNLKENNKNTCPFSDSIAHTQFSSFSPATLKLRPYGATQIRLLLLLLLLTLTLYNLLYTLSLKYERCEHTKQS